MKSITWYVLIINQLSSVWRHLLCRLLHHSGRELGNHSTRYWERPLSSSGKGGRRHTSAPRLDSKLILLFVFFNLSALKLKRVPFCREDLGFRWVSEQVSHHPPVSAFQAEGLKEDFVFHGSIYPKLKFWGKSIEAEPRGVITLELPR